MEELEVMGEGFYHYDYAGYDSFHKCYSEQEDLVSRLEESKRSLDPSIR